MHILTIVASHSGSILQEASSANKRGERGHNMIIIRMMMIWILILMIWMKSNVKVLPPPVFGDTRPERRPRGFRQELHSLWICLQFYFLKMDIHLSLSNLFASGMFTKHMKGSWFRYYLLIPCVNFQAKPTPSWLGFQGSRKTKVMRRSLAVVRR